MTDDFNLDSADVGAMVLAFDDIANNLSFVDDYGADAAFALANLIGRFKEQAVGPVAELDVWPRRGMYQAFEEKAKELEELRAEDLTENTPYSLFYSLLDNRYSAVDFMISNNSTDSVSSLLDSLENYLPDVGSDPEIKPAVRLGLFLSSRTQNEYANIDFSELAELFVSFYFE